MFATDLFNRMQAIGIIPKDQNFYKAKLIRNRVVHEYAEEDWLKIIGELRKYAPQVLAAIANTNQISQKILDNPDYQ